MAHILYRLGEAALRPRQVADKLLPPLIGFEEAMKLRAQFYREQMPWPYEHVVPGAPTLPAGAEKYHQRREQKEAAKTARLKEIQDAMAKMPSLVAQYKESRRMDWEEVDPVDYLILTKTAIRRKYMRKRLTKQG